MTPLVDGKVHSFETRGLYDGLSILWDAETGTIWNHITGVGLDGPLAGRRLGPIGNLIHTTVEAALDADPDTRVAISERPIARETRWAALAEKVPALMPLFRNTMGREDTRRPTMDVGLGVWSDEEHARYYPLDALIQSDKVLFDRFGGRRVVIYFDPVARAPMAIFTAADRATWKGTDLLLSTGEVLRRGTLYDTGGQPKATERPLQLFTRWYGWSLTFPRTSVHGKR